MGNWTSHRPKMVRSSTTYEDDGRRTCRNNEEMRKSKSLNELNRRASMRNGQNRGSSRTNASSRTSVARSPSVIVSRSFSHRKSFRKDPQHPISPQGRDIIVNCFENSHADIGNRICMRVFERRSDYQRFILALGKEKWSWVTNTLRDFIEEVVLRIDDLAKIDELSRKYGEDHVELKPFGFKPDFWVSLADAMIVECVVLDMASHQPTDTVAAWSQLVSLMFSSIRDGYYEALRQHRKSSRRSLQRQSTADSAKTASTISRDTNNEMDSVRFAVL
ncbi:unnamed protein product [Toxocara canis]|uniref:GLOBIN domain-containing protein n=1 Tax=Toxocara canis TaxID=6265 RepID=A0A183UYI4_TOXCA|nr:unnamed protein product [Toxocara canis]